MKKLILSILIASFAIRAIATEPLEKLPAIVIDTIYVSSGSLIVSYEVLRPFDHVSLTVQASWSMALKDAKPVILSGSTGKGKASIPVGLTSDQVTHFNVFMTGGQFVNKGDTVDYQPNGYNYAIFQKQKDNTVKQFRTRYTEQEKSMMDEQIKNKGFIRSLGQFDGTSFSDSTKILVNEKYDDPLSVDIYQTIGVPMQQNDSINGPSRSDYTFNISGYVRTEEDIDGWSTFIPATDVFLKFRNSSQPNDLYYFYDLNNSCALFEGVHYSRTDGSGNFSFNFPIDATLINQLNINEAIIFVARDNEYVALAVSGTTLEYKCNVHVPVFWGNQYSTIAIDHSVPGIQVSNKEIIVNDFKMASSLGMFWYAGKLANLLLGYNLQIIPIYETNASYSGQFNCSFFYNPYINLNENRNITSYNLLVTPTHEYGHYLHYHLWNSNCTAWGNSSDATAESFAMFYSYAARHFAYKNGFGLTTPPGVDTTLTLIRANTNNYDIAPFTNFSSPFSSTYPNHARWASYLWELFDGHPTFQAVNSDNDDITYPWRVIQTWANIRDISNFPNNFKSGLSASENASIDGIYNYTVNDGAMGMRSQNFSTTSMSTTSNSLIVSFTHEPYGMSTYFGNNIRNNPTGFRIYRKNFSSNCPWTVIGTIPYDANQTSYSKTINVLNPTLSDYKLVVYNSSGESAYPQSLTYINSNTQCPVIVGSDVVYNSASYLINNLPSNQVTWSLSNVPQNSIFNLSYNGATATVTVPNKTDNPAQTVTLNALLNGMVVDSKIIKTCAITGPAEICNLIGQEYYFSSLEPASWSVTSGFTLSPQNAGSQGYITVIPSPLAGQTGTLTAVVNGKTYTKAINACVPQITGPYELCYSETFAISHNYSATNWSVSAGFSVSATTGNNVTVTAAPNAGAGTITAVVNGITLTKNVIRCGYVQPIILGPDIVCPSTATYTTSTGQVVTWDVVPSMNFTITPINGGTSAIVNVVSGTPGVGGTVMAKINGVTIASKSISLCNITGPDKICGTATYTLVNSPFPLYSWVCPVPGFTLISSTSTSATVQTNYTNGESGVIIAVLGPAGNLSKTIIASCSKSSSSSYVTAYPNPANNILYIEIDAADIQSLLSVKVNLTFDVRLYDGQGNMLRNTKTKGGIVEFDVSNLTEGMYYLHVYDGVNSTPEMQMILVEH